MLQHFTLMQRTRTQALLLWIAATDATFEMVDLPAGPALSGKCIHCGARQTLTLSGRPISRATVEHIVPQCHGGTDDLGNLAIACSRCNTDKGVRHDSKPPDDPKLRALIERLRERRRARMRPPLPGLTLPPLRLAGTGLATAPAAERAHGDRSSMRRAHPGDRRG